MSEARSPQMTALLEEHALLVLARDERRRRMLGEVDRDWSLDMGAGALDLGGGAVFGIDVLGTHTRSDDTFFWAWANPSFSESQRASSLLLRRVGRERRLGELVDSGRVPGTRMDAELACLIGAGVSDADGWFVGERDGEAVALLLHDARLRDEPVLPVDLGRAARRLPALLPAGHRRAVEVLGGAPPEGMTAEASPRSVVFVRGADRVEIRLDDAGGVQRAAPAPAPAAAARVAPEAPPEDAADDDDDTATIGELALGDGRLAVLDPLASRIDPDAALLPAPVPHGVHPVDLRLIGDTHGGRRVQAAYLALTGEEVVDWQAAATVTVESGILCFATPEALDRLAGDSRRLRARLDAALDASETPTWKHADLDGIVAFSPGFGAGIYDVSWGYDADDDLVCVGINCLDPAELERRS